MSRQDGIRWLGSVVSVLCLGIASASAQSGTATLHGVVLDVQKAAVPGATVTLSNVETGLVRVATSGEDGSYQFAAVRPGPNYELKVELTGFKTAVHNKLSLAVDTSTRLDVALTVGSLTDAIQVTAEAPAINTSDASIGNVISGTQIRTLPMEARNVVGLMSLQPGVTYVPTTNPNTVDPRYGSVSGARADQSNVTLDGVDVNDAQNQSAFTSVLRVTLDSVEEFRVTTSNYGADQGRSSGGQVSLVTRSGTNNLHGAGYFVNRDTKFSSNEYFLKLSQLRSNQESEAPKLDKNIYGFALGGPVRRDKLFFFGNFEGLDESREAVVTRAVPSTSFRDGVLIYQCATASECPAGSVQGFTASHAVPAGRFGLGPAALTRIDPLHIGPSRAVSQYLNRYPVPNDPGLYPGNIEAFRFAAPLDNTFRTYTGRGDYRLSGNQSTFGRVIFQDDAVQDNPQFPDQASNTTQVGKNWGLAAGWDRTFGANVVNTLRYGYTLIDGQTVGLRNSNLTTLRFIDHIDYAPGAATSGRELGTHNIVNDVSWIKGAHTLKFGTNLRWIRNDRSSNANSYFSGTANGSWVSGVGRTYRPGGPCPAPADCSGLPAVAAGGQAAYADGLIPVLGIISQTDGIYNYKVDGTVIPIGEPISRLYAAEEYEFYAQDSWRLGDTLTVTAGLRYSLFSPPYEANGQQVAPSVDLGDWFDERVRTMAQGIPSNASPTITFVPGGPVNDGPGFYAWDKNNWAPRVATAWNFTPNMVVRGGYGIVYDRVGAGLAMTFDNAGSFGLSTRRTSPFGQNNETNPAIRFVDTTTLPPTVPAPLPGGFPQTPPAGAGVITQSIDQSLRTPYAHVFNIVFGRDLGSSYAVEAAYVGRRGRNLLIRRDIAMPLNLTDPVSGVDYFTAAQQLIQALDAAGGVASRVGPIPYWENLFPSAAGGGQTATQVMASAFGGNAPDYITALWEADQFCSPACTRFGPFSYFAEQYDALAAQSSMARSQYDAMQLVFRKRYSSGYQFDVNYTYSLGKDHSSAVERNINNNTGFGSGFGNGGNTAFLVNSFEPELNYSYSDFDVRHQLNVNWLAELPFGQGRWLGSDVGPFMNAIIGDWSLAGIWRWSSGYPFNVANCRSCWSTNWNVQGNAELVDPGRLPETETTRNAVDGFPSPFENRTEAINFFRFQTPGEAGIRNVLRGDGYFTIDMSLSKSIRLPHGHQFQFRWDAFNVTNTPRFNVGNITMIRDAAASFGRYDGSLAACDGAAGRCMQLNLRYQF
jgi:hypothetical protein